MFVFVSWRLNWEYGATSFSIRIICWHSLSTDHIAWWAITRSLSCCCYCCCYCYRCCTRLLGAFQSDRERSIMATGDVTHFFGVSDVNLPKRQEPLGTFVKMRNPKPGCNHQHTVTWFTLHFLWFKLASQHFEISSDALGIILPSIIELVIKYLHIKRSLWTNLYSGTS